MAYVGTLEWAQETGGVINLNQKVQLASLAARLLPSLPAWILYRLGRVGRAGPDVDLDKLQPPATPAAVEARRQLAEVAPDYIVNHSERTYLLSRLLAGPAQQRCDTELLYVASLAHDVGLCQSSQTTSDAQCFSIRSARWATAIASDSRWKDKRVRALA
jgi:HD-GYP domain-containing protein (c-di-GMP phosphodiesterase class II)